MGLIKLYMGTRYDFKEISIFIPDSSNPMPVLDRLFSSLRSYRSQEFALDSLLPNETWQYPTLL